ncbi:Tol-Pal system subunit TolQ [Desulfolithobacter dissulfuricans]|uniref:Tol-Pal system subunit TolQ n=1 Tax=Desulfolithobacter dissulfuricans TaxID=2795293 RepID=A0A915XKT0_9BACT|nr:protein TolQ [Desulfolithobacter dissulfuricans]BCO08681.1 Tol-Pal system subunit TolQ [Desulfolithobacter dissulfuricans]
MDISIWHMIAGAGLMVKLVMFTLLVFSVVSWAIIIMKQVMFRRTTRESEEFLEQFWESKTLSDAYESAKDFPLSPEAAVFMSGFSELKKISAVRNSQQGSETLEMQLATMDNLKRAVRKAHLIEMDRLGRSLSFLATTGSATPFIGLFGTVWGIMTSFKDIGMRGSASLAVVAPGISEALVATAAGLAVAIPAVIYYNFYSGKLADFDSDIENFSTDFLNLIERDFLTRS